MTKRPRIGLFLLTGGVIVAIVVLAAGLSGLELRPGKPLAPERVLQILGGSDEDLSAQRLLLGISQLLAALTILLLPLAFLHFIRAPKAKRRQAGGEIAFLLWVLALYLLIRTFRERNPLIGNREIPLPTMPSPTGPLRPPSSVLAELVARLPPWLIPALSLGLALAFALLLVGAAWLLGRHLRPPAPAGPLERLAQEAQTALEALQDGGDWQDTVIRCYVEMSRVLDQERGIKRPRAMTPREFEQRLEAAGLPEAPVRRLTRLFERVRYGARRPAPQEEDEAVACLKAIVQACREV